jgi:signal transduction histidine kinase
MLRQIGDDLSDRHRSNLERIGKSGHHLLKLINDILDLSKIEAGHIDVAPEPVSLQALLNDCCTTLSPLVKPGVRLDSEVDPEANETITDPGLLRQIVTNLLSNALKFTESGEVTVRATADGEDRILVVSDTGTGIPSEALDAIFEEFHQVEGTSAPLKGTGLGLAITQRLTQRLGGTIQVQSQLGQGSTFTVRLPSVCASTEQETISTP